MSEGSGPVWPSMEEWAAELRSTERPQTTGYLCDGEARCCLGVLAEMAGGKPITHDDDDGGGWFVFDDGTETGLGTLDEKPEWLDDATHGVAARANDVLRWSFGQIADWLDNGAPHDNKSYPVMEAST